MKAVCFAFALLLISSIPAVAHDGANAPTTDQSLGVNLSGNAGAGPLDGEAGGVHCQSRIGGEVRYGQCSAPENHRHFP